MAFALNRIYSVFLAETLPRQSLVRNMSTQGSKQSKEKISTDKSVILENLHLKKKYDFARDFHIILRAYYVSGENLY
jgi:hypothetical protein